MLLTIHCQGTTLNDDQRAFIHNRLLAALGRLMPRVRRAEAHVADLNGPRGGEDKRCRFVVRLDREGTLTAEGRGSNFFALVSWAAQSVVGSVRRALQRRRGRRGAPRLEGA